MSDTDSPRQGRRSRRERAERLADELAGMIADLERVSQKLAWELRNDTQDPR